MTKLLNLVRDEYRRLRDLQHAFKGDRPAQYRIGQAMAEIDVIIMRLEDGETT